MFDALFPLGIEHYVLGGLLIGLGIAIPFIFTGTVAGVSTFFTSIWSYFSTQSFFQTEWYRISRGWRWFLVGGIVSGGTLYAFFNGVAIPTGVEWWRLLVGGVLVGIGARMSGGCTSGHGICGLAALEKVSLVATITFLITAIVVAHLVSVLLV
ncbi:YeeE/YedE family protein [Candidatus Kaiserbacteria bacterium]|nr:YeeE/YedE family protein [Candidatus Kaiserbacteria bacterium]MCB9812235.1 YeeE/YedE family protein [Candidatus Nomurabacteria bacterium]